MTEIEIERALVSLRAVEATIALARFESSRIVERDEKLHELVSTVGSATFEIDSRLRAIRRALGAKK